MASLPVMPRDGLDEGRPGAAMPDPGPSQGGPAALFRSTLRPPHRWGGRMKRRIALLSAGLLVVLAGHAQAPQATASAAPPTPIVLKAAHLFDGRSGQLSEPGLVVVQDGRITGVGASASVPAGSRVIDLGDATLLPGFIDAHVHIADNHDDNWAQGIYENMLRFPAEQSFHAARNAKVTLQAGVTTARNVGAPD